MTSPRAAARDTGPAGPTDRPRRRAPREAATAFEEAVEAAPAHAPRASAASRRAAQDMDLTGRPMPVLPEPKPLRKHGPARVLAVCNQKGGVGKTTTTINLGAALAGYGRRVLLVDVDPQGALSVGLGHDPRALDVTLYDCLLDDVDPREVLLETPVPDLDLLPSNIDLSAAEIQLVNEVAREQALARALEPLLPDYDYVLIDCQPSLGLLTVNSLTAADGVVIPLECEYFSLRGLALLQRTIDKLRRSRLNPKLEIEGVLVTMYDQRTLHSREVMTRLVEVFDDKVFHTVIKRTVRFPETTVAGLPITEYAPSSEGAEAYRQLARELIAHD
jgi:chromosome partitioning protein